MGRIKAEIHWECDVCNKKEISEKGSYPNKWREFTVSWMPESYFINLVSCDDCGPETFGRVEAKTFVQRLHETFKGVKNG